MKGRFFKEANNSLLQLKEIIFVSVFNSIWVGSQTSIVIRKFPGLLINAFRRIKSLFEIHIRELWQESFIRQTALQLLKHFVNLRFYLVQNSTLPLFLITQRVFLLLLVFMPVLRHWEYLILPLCLLWVFTPFHQKKETDQTFDNSWLFLILIMTLSAIITATTTHRWDQLILWWIWIIIYLLSRFCLTPAFSKKIMHTLIISSILWIFIGFWQQWARAITPMGWLEPSQWQVITVRSYSVFVNPNNFALFLIVNIVFSLFLSQSSDKWQRIIYRIILGLSLISLYLTYSRGSWILVGGILIGYLVRQFGKRGWLFGLAGLLMMFLLPGFLPRLAGLRHFFDSSLGYRFRIWQGVFQALSEYWLWGAGPGRFQLIYPWYQVGQTVSEHAHQFFLQFWLEYGVFALIGLLVVFRRLFNRIGTTLRLVRDPLEKNKYTKALFIGLLLLLIGGFSETWYVNPFLGGYFWFLAGIFSILKTETQPDQ